VVILNLALARVKGLDPVQQLVAAVPAARVIGLSINADPRFVLEVLKAGAFGYVLKEHVFEELAAAIRAVLAHKTYISQGLSSVVLQNYTDLLRDRDARFRTIFAGSAIGIALLDGKGRIVESNPALQALLGYGQDELAHKLFAEFSHPEEVDQGKKLFAELLAGHREPYRLEKEYRRKDGRLAWGRLSLAPLGGAGMEDRVAIGMLEDISDQKEAEARIRDYQEKLRSVAQESSLTEQGERRRLATDLHDHVGQILALAQVKLGALRGLAAGPLIASVDEVRQLLKETIGYTRSLGFELSPPILYDLGFESAMEWLAEQIEEQHGIVITVAADRSPKPLNEEVRVLFFQLIRELLANLVKRARPDKIAVLISRIDLDLRLTVESDGGEADLDAASPLPSPDDLGLFSIRERLRYLGGSLEAELGPGHRIRLSLMVPLMEKPPQAAAAPLARRIEEPTAAPASPAASLSEEMTRPELSEATLSESEARYNQWLELSPEALAICKAGSIVYVNPAGLNLFGAESPSQIIGKSIADVVHPDYRELFETRADLVEQGLEIIPLQEQKLLRLDGSALDVELVGTPVTYLRQPALQIIIRDISARLQAEDVLRKSAQRLAHIIDFLPDATLVIDQEGKVIAWNKAIEEMAAVKAEDMLGKDNYEYALPFYGERRPILIDLVCQPMEEIAKHSEVKREGPSLAAKTYFPMFRGREAYLYGKASTLLDSQGNIIGAIESIRDITDFLRAEAERLRFINLKSLGTLADGIAHDVNHLFAAILENIDSARLDGKIELEGQEKLLQAEQACLRAKILAKQLLSLAKGEGPTKRIASIANLLKESVNLTLSGSKSGGELSIPDDLWPVEAEEDEINQVIGNLLLNAAQATPEGAMIQIKAENIFAAEEPDLPTSEGKYVKLTFADQGGGVSHEYLDKIFDPDFSNRPQGSGLGLATAYSIIKNHSGYIKAESQEGVGTTFTVYLPATEARAFADEPETSPVKGTLNSIVR
jgi:PAS domain S-box-containing protein